MFLCDPKSLISYFSFFPLKLQEMFEKEKEKIKELLKAKIKYLKHEHEDRLSNLWF